MKKAKSKSRTYEDGIMHGLSGAIDFMADRLRMSEAIETIKTRNQYDAGLHRGGVLAMQHALRDLRRDVRNAKRGLAKRKARENRAHMREAA